MTAKKKKVDALSPSIVKEGIDENGRAYITFTLPGGAKVRTITVKEPSFLTEAVRSGLERRIAEDKDIPEEVKGVFILIYAPLIACSSGDVPVTMDEFSDMAQKNVDFWADCVRRLYPQWFSWWINQVPSDEKKSEEIASP